MLLLVGLSHSYHQICLLLFTIAVTGEFDGDAKNILYDYQPNAPLPYILMQ